MAHPRRASFSIAQCSACAITTSAPESMAAWAISLWKSRWRKPKRFPLRVTTAALRASALLLPAPTCGMPNLSSVAFDETMALWP